MSYLVIARKWRPQTFEEVVGQGHVTRTLQNAISTGRVAHGYLFTGPRGVGKTSSARILAKALNCLKGPTPTPCLECDSCKEIAGHGSVDVIEIDGASNNSVEDIRDLRERVLYSGARDRHKVYIIDEVHMLSNAAFNALLKTLEEPPPHVIFIFATTEVQKVPETILSRTQRFDFRRIGARDLTLQLKKILDSENLPSTPEALSLVARSAGGSMRDAQTLLDQVISYATQEKGKALTAEDVLQVLGGVQESEALGALIPALKGDCEPAFGFVSRLYERGADFRLALETLSEFLRAMLLLKTAPKQAEELSGLLPETLEALSLASKELGLSRVMSFMRLAAEAESQMRFAAQPRLVLELFFVRLGAARPEGSIGELFDELISLEKRISLAPSPSQGTSPPSPLPPVAGEGKGAAFSEEGGLKPAPAVAEIEEAPQVAPSSLDLEGIKASWDKVVEQATQASLLLGTCVRDAELSVFSGAELVLKARNPRQKEALDDPANRRKVELALKQVYGRELKVKMLYVAPEKPAPKAAQGSSGKPSPEELEKLRKEIPALKKFEDLFDAEVTEVKRT